MKKEYESLYFYTANDYLIINNLLLNNNEKLSESIKVANNDYIGMINEMKDNPAKRLGLKNEKLANEIYSAYKKRFQPLINENIFIIRARKDIENLKKLSTPNETDRVIYRNIRQKHLDEFVENSCYSYDAFASCSAKPTAELYSYGEKGDFIQLCLHIPKGINLIDLDKMPKYLQNEKGEIILPPFKAFVTSINNAAANNCKATVNLTVLKTLTSEKNDKSTNINLVK